MTSILISATDFHFPSKDELIYANSKCPHFSQFGFSRCTVEYGILDGKPFKKAFTDHNLFYWDNVLTNRLGSLRRSYFESLTHFNRGVKDDYQSCSSVEAANVVLFMSSSEVFYYFYFASANVISQIFKLLFDLQISNIQFDLTMISALPENDVRKISSYFYNHTKRARKIRNAYAHGYPLTIPDFRAEYLPSPVETVHAGSGFYYKPSQITANIEDSLNVFSVFMKDLKLVLGL